MALILPSQRVVPALVLLALGASGCVRESVPDPRTAAAAYADAAARGDADAIYAMLDSESRRSMTLSDVKKMVQQERAELADQAKAIRSPQADVKAMARLKFADGEDALLEIKDGKFFIASADALPTGARTPSQALEELRRVLARRSYAGLMRVLTQSSRSSMENDLRSLVQGLENPEGLDVQQTGDTAVVSVPGGHVIKLRREGGTWRVEDLD
ncbi:MAG: hypothetical protein HY898_07280 [Deltaproteobacteria bacterium]|nr:hypothetical protein [Deltaproteobacteria bacterium]